MQLFLIPPDCAEVQTCSTVLDHIDPTTKDDLIRPRPLIMMSTDVQRCT